MNKRTTSVCSDYYNLAQRWVKGILPEKPDKYGYWLRAGGWASSSSPGPLSWNYSCKSNEGKPRMFVCDTFGKDRVYSYGLHYCLAQKINVNGNVVYLLSDRDSSMNTNKRNDELRTALNGETVIRVPNDYLPMNNRYPLYSMVSQVYDTRIQELFAKSKRARKKERYYEQISHVVTERNRFCSIFGLPEQELPEDAMMAMFMLKCA